MPITVGYIRVSKEKLLDNTPLEKQQSEIRRYCENNDFVFVDFSDGCAKYSLIIDKEENSCPMQ